jgi:hypothetical protein
VSFPYSVGAANGVLRAAERWRASLIPNTSTSAWPEAKGLAEAIDAYTVAVARPQVNGPDIDKVAP